MAGEKENRDRQIMFDGLSFANYADYALTADNATGFVVTGLASEVTTLAAGSDLTTVEAAVQTLINKINDKIPI